MKKLLGTLLLLAIVSLPLRATAHDAYDDSQSNPFRLVAYAISPIGFALEWLVTRPIHFLVSQPELERVFGHTPHEDPYSSEEPYRPPPGDEPG
jgi:hypothetical protein